MFSDKNSISSDVHRFLKYDEFNDGCSLKIEHERHQLKSDDRDLCDSFKNVVVVYIKVKNDQSKIAPSK